MGLCSWVMAVVVTQAGVLEVTPAGFAAEVEGERIVVSQVVPDSVAFGAGLQVGDVLESVVYPPRAFLRRPLALTPRADLLHALTPALGDVLMVRVVRDGRKTQVVLRRTDPIPADEFEVLPLPPERLARLSPQEWVRYSTALVRSAQRANAPRPSPPRPPLALRTAAEASVSPRGVVSVRGGGVTTDWVFADVEVEFACPSSMERVTVDGPLPTLPWQAGPRTPGLRAGSERLQVALWPVAEVTKACRARQASLQSTPLAATLACQGQPAQRFTLSAVLQLTCTEDAAAAPAPAEALWIAAEGQKVVAGEAGPVKAAADWGAFGVRPVSGEVVLVDEGGRALRRLVPGLRPGPGGERTEFVLPLSLGAVATFRVALEVRFPDGTRAQSQVRTVEVITAEQRKAEVALFSQALKDLDAVTGRLSAAMKDWCADPQATVRWLLRQPEVSHAAFAEGGGSISLVLKADGFPSVLSCHRH